MSGEAREEAEERVVAVIGAGTIGLGWIALFLGHGLTVRVNSRRADAPRVVAEGLRLLAPYLPDGCADPAGFPGRLCFEPDLERAVADADVVVEAVPEDLELKRALYERIGRAAPARALLLSSASALDPDDMGARMADSGRLVVGHPCNPPHVVPLVEVVAGGRTSEAAVEEAVLFLESVGRVPVVLRGPAVPASAADRLQAALLREAVRLVREGVVTAEELDRVVTHSLGLRWAAVGPFLAFHLDGAQGGPRGWLDVGASGRLVERAGQAYGSKTYEEHVRERDARQAAVLRALAEVSGHG
ncbi:3-hydroxyacyl-CoA dehydrogenase NAD-binding domain-containing protein [Streptomyces sp. NPDC002033]|uniref:3-hydroxyacyl-CoA dehydrogenase family protein n=1 Tax=unclassified Streptomyces TaxID=2593676 RepID=UPI003319406F